MVLICYSKMMRQSGLYCPSYTTDLIRYYFQVGMVRLLLEPIRTPDKYSCTIEFWINKITIREGVGPEGGGYTFNHLNNATDYITLDTI